MSLYKTAFHYFTLLASSKNVLPETNAARLKDAKKGNIFFFRPSPSRLLPGRNTVFVPVNKLCIAYQHPAWGVKKERGPLRSPESHPGCNQKRAKPNKKQTRKQKQNKPNKNNPKRTTVYRRARSKGTGSVPMTRETLLSEAGFEKLFRTQNWVRRSKLFFFAPTP